MALQVWLPLNGTLENKGLSNVTVTNNGATVDNNGKIGKCYSFNGSNLYISTNYDLYFNSDNERSLCFWLYVTANSSIFGSNSYLYQIYVLNNTLIFNLWTSSGSDNLKIELPITINKWQHICYTWGEDKLKLYIDGEFKLESTYMINSTCRTGNYTNIGGNIYKGNHGSPAYLSGKLDDVRIYNHVLSAKEVKEISKGLILHYKLDGNDIGITIPRNGDLIPDGVELYDYILSSGTQWVDTGFIPTDGSTIMEADVQFSNVLYAENRALMGMYSGSRWHFGVSSSTWHLGMGNLYTDVTPSNIYGRHVINMNSINRLVKIDNNLVYTFNSSLASYSATIWLFKEHRADSVNILSTAKLYYCKFYNNNILVKNFLPCTYLGEPGMWDTVENKFYRNQGTGLFTLGNKITLKEYEYLLSTGTLYINTSYKVPSTAKIEMKGQYTLLPSNTWLLFGYHLNGSKAVQFGISNDSKWVLRYGSSGDIKGTAANTNLHIFTIEPTSTGALFYIDNTLVTTNNSNAFTTTYDFLIFRRNWSGTADECYDQFKLNYFKIYDNNQLVRDFIPVSYNGTPGLWDKVEWKFYGNAGSGSFTLGPEKTVQQDAPIFYDSSGYCNHGSITGTLTTNSNSPRYTKSTFVSTNQIVSNNINLRAPYTISYWQKADSTEGFTTNYYMVKWGDMFIYRDHNGSYQYSLLSSGTLPLNRTSWNHIVVVDNGSTIKAYINGNSSVSRSHTTTISTVEIGRGYNDFYASDFRIYATALSADDVKELYNTSAFVTNNGVFAEYELYEDNLSDVKKRGLLETANFYENGAESGYALDTDKTRVASNYIISEDFIEI